MEGFTFKNLSDIDALDQPTDKTKLVGMENGAPVQIPANGLRTDRVFVIDTTANDWGTNQMNPDYGDKVKAALLRGDAVWLYSSNESTTTSPLFFYEMVNVFRFGMLTNGMRELILIGPAQWEWVVFCHDE